MSWKTIPATVAKSGAEFELYGTVRGTCEALGFVSLARVMRTEVFARLHMDAITGQGIINRHDLSKVRHLDVDLLWLQEHIAREVVPLRKVPVP